MLVACGDDDPDPRDAAPDRSATDARNDAPTTDAPNDDAPTDAPASDAPPSDASGDATEDAAGSRCPDRPMRSGEATYYAADGTGACGFAAVAGELLVGALNFPDWEGSAFCGACAAIDGPSGSVTVTIVDQCPECASGDLDLSPDAFDRIAARELGRVPITWREVPCDVTGNAIWHVKDGSNPYWAAYQLRNHRNRITSLEVRGGDGSYRGLDRADYNYFIDDAMPGDATHLRATDVLGNVLEMDVPVVEDTDTPGDAQFPGCTP